MQPQSGSSDSFLDILIWMSVLIGLLAALWMVWATLRKWCLGDAQDDSSWDLWSLSDLRDMLDRGDINEVEYQTLRQQAIAALRDKDESGADKQAPRQEF